MFEYRAETDQVREHGLAVAPIVSVAWMLGHIGIHDHSVRRRVAETQGLIGLHLSENLPTPRRTGNVRVNRAITDRNGCAALRTDSGKCAHRHSAHPTRRRRFQPAASATAP
jgi:hypothetical protein